MHILNHDNFPVLLKEINDPPEQLYVEGTLPDPKYRYLCVIGSRKYTPYGKAVVDRLIAGLSGYPVVIVSGLALGIDGIAHRAAIKAKLPTVAVPGSGLNERVLYPREHQGLARDILQHSGALISEFEPDFRPAPWSFPKRNRIMAGLSHATLVIEASVKSGTMITARLAADYNRDVYAVPGSIFSEASAGAHFLIRLGATPITSPGDILDALGLPDKASPKETFRTPENASSEEMRIIHFLTHPRERDEILRMLDVSPSEANALLAMMEIKGTIKEELGLIRLHT